MKRYVVFIMIVVFFGMTSLVDAAEKKVIIGFKKGVTASREDKHHKLHRLGGHVKRIHHSINSISASIPEEQIAELLKDPDVAYVEPDILVGLTEPAMNPSVTSQEYLDSWGVTRIGGDTAVALGITGAGVKVAILDSGIDYTHPELIDNYKGGYNFVYENNDPFDDGYNSHGTHIAGIIGARNNGTGVVGVAPEVSLYAVKVLDSTVMGDLSDILAGIDWAITNKMDIINMSIGASIDSNAFRDACLRAYQAGIILVAASGNQGNSYNYNMSIDFPAAYGSVIAVSATNQDDTHASFSSYGPKIELAAPGVEIKSTFRGGGYGTLRGTSQATAHVTGAAALVLAKMKADGGEVTNVVDTVRTVLDASAMDLGDVGRDQYFGYGLVDISKALTQLPMTYHLKPVVYQSSYTLVANMATSLTITGAAFTNLDGNGAVYNPTVTISNATTSLSLTPFLFSDSEIQVAVPALQAGIYDLSVSKQGVESNLAKLTVVPELTITAAVGSRGTATIIGTGFGSYPTADYKSGLGVFVGETQTRILSWSDWKIVASGNMLVDGAMVTIKTLNGAISKAITAATKKTR
jgi:subtilisin